ncbi:uncharacterized protein BXZ73DRAFT_17359, partial [Epithele typhae]|uniref:uncharacterized protein n=1 Tax=Epithele typhae TaxID=378194 RepID=UPI0020072CFF
IWAQWAFDMFMHVPNQKSKRLSSWITMSAGDRIHATDAIFRQSIIPVKVAHLRHAQPDFWEMSFKRLFPPKEEPRGELGQSLSTCRYFVLWERLMRSLSTRHAKKVRNTLYQVFKRLHWIPHTGSDRIWSSR